MIWCFYICSCQNPRHPNTSWEDIWTPQTYLKHLLRRYLDQGSVFTQFYVPLSFLLGQLGLAGKCNKASVTCVCYHNGEPLLELPHRIHDGDFLSCWVSTLPEQETDGTCSCEESSFNVACNTNQPTQQDRVGGNPWRRRPGLCVRWNGWWPAPSAAPFVCSTHGSLTGPPSGFRRRPGRPRNDPEIRKDPEIGGSPKNDVKWHSVLEHARLPVGRACLAQQRSFCHAFLALLRRLARCEHRYTPRTVESAEVFENCVYVCGFVNLFLVILLAGLSLSIASVFSCDHGLLHVCLGKVQSDQCKPSEAPK